MDATTLLPALPHSLAQAIEPILGHTPIDQAMPTLVVHQPFSSDLTAIVAEAVHHPELARRPALQAGLWLYADELERAHLIAQSMENPTGSYWHAIMHRREGDFANSRYWLHRCHSHPVWNQVEGYEPYQFLDTVSAQHKENHVEHLAMQRREWAALFAWCAQHEEATE